MITDFIVQNGFMVLLFAILLLVVIGYEVRAYAKGVPKLSPQAAAMLQNRDSAVIVDVRPADAFKGGHIINAINVLPSDANANHPKIAKLKDKALIICCDMGNKSPAIAQQLQKNGFTKVHILQGGTNAWKEANLPLIKK